VRFVPIALTHSVSFLVSIVHHDALPTKLSFPTVQFGIGHAEFTQNDLNVEIKPATDDYQGVPFCLAVGSEFRKDLPYADMTADKFLKLFFRFLN